MDSIKNILFNSTSEDDVTNKIKIFKETFRGDDFRNIIHGILYNLLLDFFYYRRVQNKQTFENMFYLVKYLKDNNMFDSEYRHESDNISLMSLVLLFVALNCDVIKLEYILNNFNIDTNETGKNPVSDPFNRYHVLEFFFKNHQKYNINIDNCRPVFEILINFFNKTYEYNNSNILNLLIENTKDLPITKLLLDTGRGNLQYTDELQITPLMMACKINHLQIADLLLDTGQSHPEAVNNDNETALVIAAKNNNVELVKLLIRKSKLNYFDSKAELALSKTSNNEIKKILGGFIQIGKMKKNGFEKNKKNFFDFETEKEKTIWMSACAMSSSEFSLYDFRSLQDKSRSINLPIEKRINRNFSKKELCEKLLTLNTLNINDKTKIQTICNNLTKVSELLELRKLARQYNIPTEYQQTVPLNKYELCYQLSQSYDNFMRLLIENQVEKYKSDCKTTLYDNEEEFDTLNPEYYIKTINNECLTLDDITNLNPKENPWTRQSLYQTKVFGSNKTVMEEYAQKIKRLQNTRPSKDLINTHTLFPKPKGGFRSPEQNEILNTITNLINYSPNNYGGGTKYFNINLLTDVPMEEIIEKTNRVSRRQTNFIKNRQILDNQSIIGILQKEQTDRWNFLKALNYILKRLHASIDSEDISDAESFKWLLVDFIFNKDNNEI
jgi:ankyrin repeat protein